MRNAPREEIANDEDSVAFLRKEIPFRLHDNIIRFFIGGIRRFDAAVIFV